MHADEMTISPGMSCTMDIHFYHGDAPTVEPTASTRKTRAPRRRGSPVRWAVHYFTRVRWRGETVYSLGKEIARAEMHSLDRRQRVLAGIKEVERLLGLATPTIP
jgi:hypothetical protein